MGFNLAHSRAHLGQLEHPPPHPPVPPSDDIQAGPRIRIPFLLQRKTKKESKRAASQGGRAFLQRFSTFLLPLTPSQFTWPSLPGQLPPDPSQLCSIFSFPFQFNLFYPPPPLLSIYEFSSTWPSLVSEREITRVGGSWSKIKNPPYSRYKELTRKSAHFSSPHLTTYSLSLPLCYLKRDRTNLQSYDMENQLT